MKRKKNREGLSGEELLRGVLERTGDNEEKVRKGLEDLWDEVSHSSDPLVRSFWLSVRRGGDRPTAEELLLHEQLLMDSFTAVVFIKAGYSYRRARRSCNERKLIELAEQYGGAEQLMEEAMKFVIELRGEE